MLFGIVYTPRSPEGPAGTSLELFGDWRPPLAFREHWRFAAGGGMGLVESRTAAELSRSIAPFAPFFAFQVKQLEAARDEPTARRARAGVLSIA
jgi:hypothetical protein